VGAAGRDRPKSRSAASSARTRRGPLEAGRLETVGKGLIRDDAYKSPAKAASAVTGSQANGWVMWRLSDGRTLDDLRDELKERGEWPASRFLQDSE
jgi:Domain of unknown function (DUF4357)